MKFNPKTILRHVAGVTVSHRSVFSDLEVKENAAPVTQEFIEKWVTPFYMQQPSEAQFLESCRQKRKEMDDSVIDELLGEFNWRMRSVGALFAAIEGKKRCVEQIGKLLLRSDVCYAGKSYAIALASLNTDSCPDYLDRYLSYYLKKKKLWFDQAEVLSALIYLDEKREEDRHEAHMHQWSKFIKNKQYWNLERTREWLYRDLEAIENLKVEQKAGENTSCLTA